MIKFKSWIRIDSRRGSRHNDSYGYDGDGVPSLKRQAVPPYGLTIDQKGTFCISTT